jgi:hypothetical protein
MDKHCECIVPVTIQGSIICGECGGIIIKPVKEEKK